MAAFPGVSSRRWPVLQREEEPLPCPGPFWDRLLHRELLPPFQQSLAPGCAQSLARNHSRSPKTAEGNKIFLLVEICCVLSENPPFSPSQSTASHFFSMDRIKKIKYRGVSTWHGGCRTGFRRKTRNSCRILEWLGLEGSLRIISFHPFHGQGTSHYPRLSWEASSKPEHKERRQLMLTINAINGQEFCGRLYFNLSF